MNQAQARKNAIFTKTGYSGGQGKRAGNYVLPFFASSDGVLDVWLPATVEVPEIHAALVAEWHSRNFSSDEVDMLNKVQQSFLPQHDRYLCLVPCEVMEVQDEA